ncbi:TPA: AroM family protein [Kluyvera cryocrescens]|uniref:AroM family protein n=1 Tax=Kluyvera cryocrescens TaxID=580 RepID=A0AAW9C723_KLUCR|nr:AroM family protein [Kluyvera cryocrescens]MCX2868366.1 AroM family protein [Kluyvera cryocrescens]MDU5684756.1 AroM family protein [Kluyvera cryocrescens]MDW3777492.1 AroM family protein [Kluyvera cryocrescens]MEB6631265.1 AroM family protein [Kluyvera cryocrescens]MEB7711236.1 AroM family protein [Kluyvera cryocrescens]
MSATMAILTIGVVPISEVLPLLTEHIREDQITHITLLGNMSRADVMEEYGPEPGEERLLVLLNDNQFVEISRLKVEHALQAVIEVLDNQSYDVILLLNTFKLRSMTARNAILLEPQRIIPPLVASIVEGHQVGVLVPIEAILKAQKEKWQMLPTLPYYALANPVRDSDQHLISAGTSLLEQGADVLVLDSLSYHQRHRDLLQKALDVPVLLSNVLVARLAAELLC